MYNDTVMDYFTNPRNVGEIEDASGVGTVGERQMRRHNAHIHKGRGQYHNRR